MGNKDISEKIIELANQIPYYEWLKIVGAVEKAKSSTMQRLNLAGADVEEVKKHYYGL